MIRSALPMVLALVLAGCDDLVDDSSFQLWCDGSPCAWEVEQGSVSRAPTWHERDYGVSLDADPTVISQVVPASRIMHTCLRFDVIVSTSRGSELRLELDFDDDGTIELERTLDRNDHAPDVFFVGVPIPSDGVRIRLVKYGPGAASIAQLRVRGVADDEGCLGPSP